MERMEDDGDTPQKEILEVHMMALSDNFQLSVDVVAALKTDTTRFVKAVKALDGKKNSRRTSSNSSVPSGRISNTNNSSRFPLPSPSRMY
jgi:hypothetical protein